MPLGYRLVRALSRLLLRLFYRRVEVVGAELVDRHHDDETGPSATGAWR